MNKMKITIEDFKKYYNNLKFEGINDKHCVREKIVCEDGFTFSCQHSYYHYCNLYTVVRSESDKQDGKTSNLEINESTTFEIMFRLCTQRATKKLHKYKSDCLYVNVPCDVVIGLINYHGGVKNKKKKNFKHILKTILK
jgi:hypothetical protein